MISSSRYEILSFRTSVSLINTRIVYLAVKVIKCNYIPGTRIDDLRVRNSILGGMRRGIPFNRNSNDALAS